MGVLTDMSGLFATAMGPGSVEAARMAAGELRGKINGKSIDDGPPEPGARSLAVRPRLLPAANCQVITISAHAVQINSMQICPDCAGGISSHLLASCH